MENYKVYYDYDGTKHTYGTFLARNQIEAIEQVIKDDPNRTRFNIKTELDKRHHGLFAKLIKPKLESKMQKDFDKLKDKYDETIKSLTDVQAASSFGATFEYEDGSKKFIPIFDIETPIEQNEMKPLRYTLNFDQSTLAYWITYCKSNCKTHKE